MSEKYLFFTVTDLNRTRDELEQDDLYGISAFYDSSYYALLNRMAYE